MPDGSAEHDGRDITGGCVLLEVHSDSYAVRATTKESRHSKNLPVIHFGKGVIAMEKRKEYADGEIITCPRCGADDLDCEEAPDRGKCLTCGLEFTIRQVAVWEE